MSKSPDQRLREAFVAHGILGVVGVGRELVAEREATQKKLDLLCIAAEAALVEETQRLDSAADLTGDPRHAAPSRTFQALRAAIEAAKTP